MGNCCAADSDKQNEDQNVNYSSSRAPVDNFSGDLIEKNTNSRSGDHAPKSYEAVLVSGHNLPITSIHLDYQFLMQTFFLI